jgi:hypothetical protein
MTRARKAMIASTVVVGIGLALTLYRLAHRGPIPDKIAPIATCRETTLAPEVEALVRPVLMAHGGQDWGPDYAALEEVIGSTQPAGREARIALMAYYLGEHPAEELLESILADGPSAIPLVRKYSQCRPPLTSEWRLSTVVVLRTLYDLYGEHAGGAG